MKRLNEKEWEIMKDALSFKQLEEIQMKGSLTLNKKQMLEALIESNKEVNEYVLKQVKEENVQDEYKEMVRDMRRKAIQHIEENTKLFTKIINDKEDYEVSFMKGNRG